MTVLFTLTMMVGCAPSMPAENLIRYMDGLAQKHAVQSANYTYVLYYQPTDYIIAMESKGEPVEKAVYEKRKQELDGQIQLRLSLTPLSPEANESKEAAYFRLEDFELRELLLLKQGGQMLKPVFVHRQDEGNGKFSILLSYEGKLKGDLQLHFEELDIPGISLPKDELKGLPKLKR